MSNQSENEEEDTRRLIVAITDFLRDQLIIRTDMVPEDRDCLEIAIQCLEMAYGLEAQRYMQYRFSRPLLDIFNQVTNPVSIKDKLRADALKDEGNSYMRRNMFSNAETEFTNAIELDRWNAIYYCNRASSLIEQRKYFEAISDCRQALVLNPDYAKAHARMGQAYALIQRPREAARCFRQALELDPSNERYRNNLRVAESQVTRPDAMGIIASLISSMFGVAPGGSAADSSSRSMPTSFMIITESHPPRTDSDSETTESSQTDESQTVARRATEEQNIAYPQPYGVIDEGEEEQPILQLVMDDPDNEEFQLDFPGFIIFQDLSMASPMDSEGHAEVSEQQDDQTSQAGEKTDDLAEKEKDVSRTGVSLDGGEGKEEVSPDVDSKPSEEEGSPERKDGGRSAEMESSDKSKKSSDLEENETDDFSMTDIPSDDEKAKKQAEELDKNRSDSKDLSTEHKMENASLETEKAKTEHDSEPIEGGKPADKIVLPIDPAISDSFEHVLNSVNDSNTEGESKKGDEMKRNTFESNNYDEENERNLRSMKNDNLIDDKEGKNADMKGEHSSFNPEKETAEREINQTTEKEGDQSDQKEESKKSGQ